MSPADEPDEALVTRAAEFAEQSAQTLERTIASSAPVTAQVRGVNVVVAPYNDHGDRTSVPLSINAEHRLDLRVEYWCRWDFTRQFLSVQESILALTVADLGEPLVRFEYMQDRPYAPAHVQVHGESGALGHLLSWKRLTKPPKLQHLHVPVGGRRFRPCLEDVIEFAIQDLGVDAHEGWRGPVGDGRRQWREIQMAAAIRDLMGDAPEEMREKLKQWVDQAYEAVT